MNNSQISAENNYKIINYLLAGVILCIFIYSGLFSPEGGKYLVPSFYTQLTGEISPSTGLSRSFSAIVRGDLQLAKVYNPIGLQIFLFFLLQFIFRIISILLIKVYLPFVKTYITIDIITSTIGFYLAFKPLILFTIKLFQESPVDYL